VVTVTQRPDSRFTRFRRRLAKRIEPLPPEGEAWCINCVLNDGKTLILPANSGIQHVDAHRDSPPSTFMQLQIGMHPVGRGEDDHGR
jgi:hypothetical protein